MLKILLSHARPIDIPNSEVVGLPYQFDSKVRCLVTISLIKSSSLILFSFNHILFKFYFFVVTKHFTISHTTH